MKFKYWVIENDHNILYGTNAYDIAKNEVEGNANMSMLIAKTPITRKQAQDIIYNS